MSIRSIDAKMVMHRTVDASIEAARLIKGHEASKDYNAQQAVQQQKKNMGKVNEVLATEYKHISKNDSKKNPDRRHERNKKRRSPPSETGDENSTIDIRI